MSDISIGIIKAHCAYTAEYDIKGFEDIIDVETGSNILYDLQYLMEDENPDVHVPEDGNDYNYYEYPVEMLPDGRMHFIYFDMVDKKGQDNKDGAYRFVDVPEIEAALMKQKGPFNAIEEGFKILYNWIEREGYEITGPGRVSAIHGPWDRDHESEYENELQVPVRKK